MQGVCRFICKGVMPVGCAHVCCVLSCAVLWCALLRLICTKVSPVEVAQNAVEDARSACMRTYGSAPEVEIYGDPSFTFA